MSNHNKRNLSIYGYVFIKKKVYSVPFPYMRKNEENYKKELSFALIEIQEA